MDRVEDVDASDPDVAVGGRQHVEARGCEEHPRARCGHRPVRAGRGHLAADRVAEHRSVGRVGLRPRQLARLLAEHEPAVAERRTDVAPFAGLAAVGPVGPRDDRRRPDVLGDRRGRRDDAVVGRQHWWVRAVGVRLEASDLGRRQGAVVDADLVDRAGEVPVAARRHRVAADEELVAREAVVDRLAGGRRPVAHLDAVDVEAHGRAVEGAGDEVELAVPDAIRGDRRGLVVVALGPDEELEPGTLADAGVDRVRRTVAGAAVVALAGHVAQRRRRPGSAHPAHQRHPGGAQQRARPGGQDRQVHSREVVAPLAVAREHHRSLGGDRVEPVTRAVGGDVVLVGGGVVVEVPLARERPGMVGGGRAGQGEPRHCQGDREQGSRLGHLASLHRRDRQTTASGWMYFIPTG